MKSHISAAERDFALEKAIREQLKKARLAGMGIGAKTIASVIKDIAIDENKTSEQKLKEILDYCETGTNIKVDQI